MFKAQLFRGLAISSGVYGLAQKFYQLIKQENENLDLNDGKDGFEEVI